VHPSHPTRLPVAMFVIQPRVAKNGLVAAVELFMRSMSVLVSRERED
jgi:hypothetical protein